MFYYEISLSFRSTVLDEKTTSSDDNSNKPVTYLKKFNKNWLAILIIIFIGVSIALGVYLTQQRTRLDQQAITQQPLTPSTSPKAVAPAINLADLPEQQTGIEIAYCNVMFWNVNPPPESLEPLKQQVRQALVDVQTDLGTGASFQLACENKTQIIAQNKNYISYRYGVLKVFKDAFLLNAQNKHIDQAARQMNIGDVQLLESYDGGYVNDDIAENDDQYHAGYYLITRIK